MENDISNIRIALALHGQPRFAAICYEHFYGGLIETLNADVYFHTWWSPAMVGTQYPCAPHARRALRQDDLLVRDSIKDDLLEMYKPKAHFFEDYKDVRPLRPGYNINYQYYSQWQVKRLMAIYHPSYDLVIRGRFDLMCTQDIEFQYDDNLWVSGACPYTDGIRYNDMFSISNWDIFNKISNTYVNIHEYEKVGKGDMEWALGMQIKRYNIPVKTFVSSYDTFDILRSESADKFR